MLVPGQAGRPRPSCRGPRPGDTDQTNVPLEQGDGRVSRAGRPGSFQRRWRLINILKGQGHKSVLAEGAAAEAGVPAGTEAQAGLWAGGGRAGGR